MRDPIVKHGLVTILSVGSAAGGMFLSGWALHAGMAGVAVAAGMFGGAGMLAMGIFIFYFAD